MTNKEYLIKEIDKKKYDDKWLGYVADFTIYNFCILREESCDNYKSCTQCKLDWINEKYEPLMPELKTGMFVKVRYNSWGVWSEELGVVTGDRIVYKNGCWDELEDARAKIIMVYDETAKCFNSCLDENIIWKRDD